MVTNEMIGFSSGKWFGQTLKYHMFLHAVKYRNHPRPTLYTTPTIHRWRVLQAIAPVSDLFSNWWFFPWPWFFIINLRRLLKLQLKNLFHFLFFFCCCFCCFHSSQPPSSKRELAQHKFHKSTYKLAGSASWFCSWNFARLSHSFQNS